MKYIYIVVVGLVVCIFMNQQINALSLQLSWMTSPLSVTEVGGVPYHQVGCKYQYVSTIHEIDGMIIPGGGQLCVVEGEKLSYIYDNIYLGNDEWFSGVTKVKLPNSQYYVDITDTGEHLEYAIYATETDTLVEILVRDNTTVVRITPHISDNLIPGRADITYGVLSYGPDYSASQEYTFLSSQLFDVSNSTISANGQFVYMSLAEKIIDSHGNISFKQVITHKIDMERRVVEAFVLPEKPTGNQIVAVSPTGRYIVSGRGIVDTNDCHYSVEVNHRLCSERSYAAALDRATGYDAIAVNNSENPISVWFSGGETSIALEALEPIMGNPTGKFYKISIAPPLDYLALGDSYSSGEGDIGKKADGSSYYISGPDGGEKCHLSSRSYPFLLGAKLGEDNMTMQSVACSGARIDPDYYGTERYNGQQNQHAQKSASELTASVGDALQNFTPGQVRQLDFVKEYRPKMITFTGGGNDVGFADILAYCAQPKMLGNKLPVDDTCTFVSDDSKRASLNRLIDEQYTTSKKFIEEVRKVSPETEIYMIGYPQFVKNGAEACFRGSPLLNDDEIKFVRQGVTRLNNVLKRMARDTGIYFIDVENSLEGGQICQGSEYMTGPVRRIVNNRKTAADPNMYHPNAAGHAKMAEHIAKQIKEKPGYDIIDIPSEEDGTRVVRTAVLSDYAGVGSTQLVTMRPGIIKADGTSSINIFSNKVHLGAYTTDASGALNVQITIPKEVGIGYHLLTIDGLDVDDQPVQVQQFVYVISDNPDDIDGDGIPNEHDPCFVVTEWYVGDVNECAPTGLGDTKQPVTVDISQNSSKKVGSSSDEVDWIAAATSSAGRATLLLDDKPTTTQSTLRGVVAQEAGTNSWQTALWLILPFGLIILIGIIYGYQRTNQKNA